MSATTGPAVARPTRTTHPAGRGQGEPPARQRGEAGPLMPAPWDPLDDLDDYVPAPARLTQGKDSK